MHAWSEAEGIVMVLTSPWAYNFNSALNKKQSIFVLYLYQIKVMKLLMKLLFILTELYSKLMIILKCEQWPQLAIYVKLPCQNRDACVDVMLTPEEHNTRSTPVNCAVGTVILAGTVKIMPALLTNQMTGNLPMRYIIFYNTVTALPTQKL